MFIKSGAIISEVFNIAKAQKNSGPQEMFSKSGCLVYPLTLFRASTVVYNVICLENPKSSKKIGRAFKESF